MRRPLNTDLIGGSLGLFLAGSFWLARESNWSFWSAVFPNVIIVIIAALSLMLLLKGFLRPAMLPVFEDGNRTRMVVASVLLLAWGFAFSWLGAVASSFIAFAVLAAYLAADTVRFDARTLLLGAVVIAAEIAVFYFLFVRVLHVPLPRGILF